MRVGIVCPYTWDVPGGVQAHVRDLAECLIDMILLASDVVDGRPEQPVLGGLDIAVRRNAFGSQVDSFEQDLTVKGVGEVHGVFIRAPWVERVGPDVEVLACVGEHPVAVRQGRLLATSFHPELTDDHRVHELFLTSIKRD